MDVTDLTDALEQHRLWLETNGREGRRAILIGANLRNAMLLGANLSRADLSGADLSRADLSRADLSGANLSGANLLDAILCGANFRKANLRGADLSGADRSGANLRNADLRGSRGFPVAADAPQRLLAVARAALADDSALAMDTWHICQTTHCIAGWAIYHAGEPGRLLEESHGPGLAGRMLLGHEAALHFYDTNDDARAWLQSVLDTADGEVQP